MYLYILPSQSTGRYYIGVTEEVVLRLAQHNDPESNPSR
jgi:predicted GIY-YIG superfamily endonuclease